jgi:hypothetical protein
MTGPDDPAVDDWVDRAHELFLTDVWGLLVDEDDRVDGYPSWVESWLRGLAPGGVPDHPTAAALHRVLAAGVDVDDLTDVVRAMQYELLYSVCQLLDDPGLLGIRIDVDPDEVAAGWQLMAVRGAPTPDRRPIYELHSSLGEYDPSGRAGEPRGRPIPAHLPGQPLYARLAVAQARAGDKLAAIRTWRAATGATSADAKAAIDGLLNDVISRPDEPQ